jgi:hypothetical protein
MDDSEKARRLTTALGSFEYVKSQIDDVSKEISALKIQLVDSKNEPESVQDEIRFKLKSRLYDLTLEKYELSADLESLNS